MPNKGDSSIKHAGFLFVKTYWSFQCQAARVSRHDRPIGLNFRAPCSITEMSFIVQYRNSFAATPRVNNSHAEPMCNFPFAWNLTCRLRVFRGMRCHNISVGSGKYNHRSHYKITHYFRFATLELYIYIFLFFFCQNGKKSSQVFVLYVCRWAIIRRI